jgi:hypothetical protein
MISDVFTVERLYTSSILATLNCREYIKSVDNASEGPYSLHDAPFRARVQNIEYPRQFLLFLTAYPWARPDTTLIPAGNRCGHH